MRFLKRILSKRMEEADLNKEAANAANHYLKAQGHIPLAEKTAMLNYTAHGFYMGFRKAEEKHGISKKR